MPDTSKEEEEGVDIREVHDAVMALGTRQKICSRPGDYMTGETYLKYAEQEMAAYEASCRMRGGKLETSVSDADVLEHPSTAAEALTRWYQMAPVTPRGGFDDGLCVKVENATLSIAVDLGEQDVFEDEMFQPITETIQVHTVRLKHLGSSRSMALHRLCYVAKTFFPQVQAVEIVAWCKCEVNIFRAPDFVVVPRRRGSSQEHRHPHHRAGRVIVSNIHDVHPADQRSLSSFDDHVRVLPLDDDDDKKTTTPSHGGVSQGGDAHRHCIVCNASGGKLMLCATCKRRGIRVLYCSQACQRAHWKQHKLFCLRTFSSEAALRDAALRAGLSLDQAD